MKPSTDKKTEAGFDKQLPMFVLDVLRYDIESISSVLNLLNDDSETVGWREFWPRDFSSQDILPVLEELIEGELIVPYAMDARGAELVESPDRGTGLRNDHRNTVLDFRERAQEMGELDRLSDNPRMSVQYTSGL